MATQTTGAGTGAGLHPRLRGTLLVLVSAVSFATLPLFGKVAYRHGVDPLALLAWRFVVATAVLWTAVVVTARRRREPVLTDRPVLGRLALVGAIGLSPEIVLYFAGLQRVSAGLAETLLFLYPAWVVVIGAVALRVRPDRVVVACVLAAVAGAALSAGDGASGQPLGVLLVVAASVLFAGYVVVSGRLAPRVGGLRATTVTLSAAGAVLTAAALLTRAHGPTDAAGWGSAVAMALLGTVVPFGLLTAGLVLLPAAQASVVSTVEPAVTVVLGAVLLGEQVGALQVVGTLLVLGAVVVLMRQEARAGQMTRDLVEVAAPHE